MILRARPWLVPTFTLIVICVLELLSGHRYPVVDILFWIALAAVTSMGVAW